MQIVQIEIGLERDALCLQCTTGRHHPLAASDAASIGIRGRADLLALPYSQYQGFRRFGGNRDIDRAGFRVRRP